MEITTRRITPLTWLLVVSIVLAFIGMIIVLFIPHSFGTTIDSQRFLISISLLIFIGVYIQTMLQQYFLHQLLSSPHDTLLGKGSNKLILVGLFVLPILSIIFLSIAPSSSLVTVLALVLNSITIIGVVITLKTSGNLWRLSLKK